MMTIFFALLIILILSYLLPFVGYVIEYLIDKHQDKKQTEYDKDDLLINKLCGNRLKSPAEVAMNPPRLPSPDLEHSYRESKVCHHCGCNCGKVIVKEVINECEDCYMPEDDCKCFGPPL